MNQNFSPKDPEEVITVSIDFANVMSVGETVSECTFDATILGTTEVENAMISGLADISDAPLVKQKIIGGTDGATYKIRAKITTSAGMIFIGSGDILVRRGA